MSNKIRVFFSDGTSEDIGGGRYDRFPYDDPQERAASHQAVFIGMSYSVTEDESLIVSETYQVQRWSGGEYGSYSDVPGRTTQLEVARFRPSEWSRVQRI